ncbi:MAG: choice-of-anchor D domain-containing protein [Chitinophagaceae bacterium]|nr:MAG: choice-of-anchor D domain-containing protein [Chitinophagaceae bacterium]
MKNKILLFLLFTFLAVNQIWAQTTITSNTLASSTLINTWSPVSITAETAGGGYARFTSTSSSLTTPSFNASTYGTVTVELSVAKYGNGGDGPITVRYSLDNGTTWTNGGNSSTPSSSSYVNSSVTINATSANMRIQFTRTGSASEKRVQNVVIKGNPPISPTITVGSAVTGLDYAQGSGPSVGKPFTLSGSNLTANISLQAPTNFELSTSINGFYSDVLTVNHSSGSVATNTTRYVRLKAGLTVGNYSGNITANSTDATEKTIAISGTVSGPALSISANPDVVNFGTVPTGTTSAPQTIAITAQGLTGNIALNSEHSGFQISLDGTTWGSQLTLVRTAQNDYSGNIQIRYNASTTGAQSGKVTMKVGGTTYEEIDFSGTGQCVTLPVTPSNSFTTSNNPSCGPATLSYTGTVPAGETYYWQTSASDASIATPVSSNQTINTTGSRFVRSRNNTTQCWSDAIESPVVTINTAVAITTQPVNSNILIGTTATFSVSATGTAPLTYQWQINTGSTWEDIQNATTNTHTTPSATMAMSGHQYRVNVTNSCGTLASNAVTLTVSEPTIVLTSNFSLFSYAEGQGPSTNQVFTISGTNLADAIVVTAPSNWEISTNATFTTPQASITLSKNASNAISTTNIYIRLKAGLPQALYSGTLQATSVNAATKTAVLSGEVAGAVAFINVEANLGTFPDITNGTNNPVAVQNTLFAARQIGTSEAKSYRIQNLGGATLNLPALTITGANPSDFTVSTPPPSTIAPGAIVTFEVSFSPTATGLRNAIVNIPNNSANANPFTFNIRGTGNNAEIGVSGNAVDIVNGSTIVSTADNTLIGNANADTANPTTISKAFTISNTGNIPLSVTNISISDASNFSVSPTTATVAVGATAVFNVTFNPTSAGIKEATVSIANNDATENENPFTFAVRGNATNYIPCAPGGLGPVETIGKQDFETPLGTPTMSYTIINSGNSGPGGASGVVTGNTPSSTTSPANSPYYSSGNAGYRIQGRSGYEGRALEFSAVNTTDYNEVTLSVRIAGMSIGSASNGMDSSSDERVLVEVSPDNGDTWYEQATLGSSQANIRWAFASATGKGTRAYLANNASTSFTNGSNAISGTNANVISTIEITGLPAVTQLKVRISAQSNDANESWILDDIIVSGKKNLGPSEKTWNGTAWSGDGVPPTASQKAIIAGNYNTADSGNITACECEVLANVTLTVAPKTVPTLEERYISIESEIVNHGTIEVLNNNSLYQTNDFANNTGGGNMIMHRISQPMYRYDLTYWSSPLTESSGFKLGGPTLSLSPMTLFDKFFKWNHAGDPQGWTTINVGNEVMVPGRGYAVRAPQNYSTNPSNVQVYTATFTGIPNNGLVEHAVTGGTDKWNLIGNPYPSALDIEKFLFENRNLLEGTIYLWTHNSPLSQYQYTAHDYATYNFTGPVSTKPSGSSGSNTNTPTQYVASGQSFFVKGLSSGNVVFHNGMREKAHNHTFFRPAVTTPAQNWEMTGKHRIWLNIYNTQGAFNQTLVGYMENATNGLDWGFDGERMSGNHVALYSLLDGNELTIQGRGLPFNNQDIVPMGFTNTLNGTLQIGLDHFDGIFEGQDIFLEDLTLNITHNLKEAAYSFNATPGTFNDRFVLKFINTTLGNDNPEAVANGVLVYNNKGEINIKSVSENIQDVTVYDLLGRVVFEKKNISNNQFSASNIVMNEQVLIVKVTLENGVMASKKIVY